MNKMLTLSLAFFAIAATSAYPSHSIVADTYSAAVIEPVIAPFAKVGEIVHSVPSAVSHQSQTVVHGRTHVLSDVVVAPVAAEVNTAVEVAAAAPVAVEVKSAAAEQHIITPAAVAAAPLAVLPPSEISFHGTPLLKSIAAASALASSSYVAAPLAFYH